MSEVTYFILYILQHNKGRHQPFWSDPLNPIFCLIFLSGDAPFSPCAGATLACAGRGTHTLGFTFCSTKGREREGSIFMKTEPWALLSVSLPKRGEGDFATVKNSCENSTESQLQDKE